MVYEYGDYSKWCEKKISYSFGLKNNIQGNILNVDTYYQLLKKNWFDFDIYEKMSSC